LDAVTGTTNSDSVSGNNTTLTAGDSIDLGDGSDTMVIASSAAATLGGFTVANVENVMFSASGGALIVDALQITGATTIGVQGSSQDATINSISGLPTLKLANNSGGNATFANAVTTGTQEQSLELTSSTTTTLTIAGIETLNVAASGAVTVGAMTTTSTETLNVSGNVSTFVIAALDGAIETIDASGLTASVYASWGGIGANDMTITGSAGTDIFDFTGGNPDSDDTVDGGDGLDILTVDTTLTSTTDVSGFSNVERLQLNYASDGTTDASCPRKFV
jgi:hypothetical protein